MNRLQLNSSRLAQIQQWANQESEIQHLALNVLALRGDTALNELPEFSNPPSAKLSAKSNNAQTTSRSINTSLSVYPNPSNGLINLSFGKSVKGSIAVSNIMGQWLVTQSVMGESSTLDLSEFSSGIYFVTFMSENGADVQSFKVIKQ